MKKITIITLVSLLLIGIVVFVFMFFNRNPRTSSDGIKPENEFSQFLNVSGGTDLENNVYISLLAPLDYKLYEAPASQDYFNNNEPYELELIDKNKSLVKKYSFGTNEMSVMTNGGDQIIDSGMFGFSIPYQDSVDMVIIREGKDIIFEKKRSLHAPDVKIVSPENNAVLSGEIIISWSVVDEDEDDVLCSLESRTDDDESWSPETAFISELQINKDVKYFNTEGGLVLRVLCSDGLDTSADTINVSVEK